MWLYLIQPLILNKINELRTINNDGSITFSGLEIYTVLPTLSGMIEFPKSINSYEIDIIIWKAIFAIKLNIDKDTFIKKIEELYSERFSVNENKYYVLTSISINENALPEKIILDDIEIIKCKYKYPDKYKSRNELLKKFGKNDDNDYTKIIIKLKEKTIESAFSTALDVVDMLRGILCLQSNPSFAVSDDEWQPINNIRLGECHTIHNVNGKIASEVYWYDPNYIRCDLYKPDNIDIFRSNTKYTIKTLKKSKYRNILEESIIRYVRAFDEKDQHSALVKMWSSLECLTGIQNTRFDDLIRRVSFLYKDNEYIKIILEHIKDNRNKSVHSGDRSEGIKADCYQLQDCFYQMLYFHLNNNKKFESFIEANQYLDLPYDISTLNKNKKLLERAIKFRK